MQMHEIHFSNVQNKSTLSNSRFQGYIMLYNMVYGIGGFVLLISNQYPILSTLNTLGVG